MSFFLSREPLDESTAATSSEDGAVATFIGRVRDHNDGRPVTALEYESYEELARSEGERIVEEALGRFRISSASCAHRIGLLQIGDAAIRVDVSSPHRQAAFEACRYIVDEAKRRLPIWKKEQYADGSSEWVNCAGGRPADTNYYSRQTCLPEVGPTGQEALRRAKVLVVGAGGLGCAALHHLAGAGVGMIGICDFDALHESNLHRQSLYAFGQVGQIKVKLAAERLRSSNPYIQVVEHREALTITSGPLTLGDYDIVLDCTDNFETKFLLNDLSISMGKTLVQASIYQFEGQILLVLPSGPCLRCVWPEEPQAGCVGSCAEVGVLGFVPGVFGSLQAAETIKLILGMESPFQSGKMLLFNILDYGIQNIQISRRDDCPGCGSGVVAEISEGTTVQLLDDDILVDIRPADEAEGEPCSVSCLAGDPADLARAQPERRVVLMCRTGARSLEACRALRAEGLANVFSFKGGLMALMRVALSEKELVAGGQQHGREQPAHP